MDTKMDKIKLLDLIQLERAFLERTIAPLSVVQMIQPGVHSDWSVKDILVHIVVWEQRFLRWLATADRGETPQRPEPGYTWDDIDRLNEDDVLANRDRLLNDVLVDFRRSYVQALGKVADLSEAALCDPGYHAWRDGDPLWTSVAANMHWHYAEHAEAIRHWLNGAES